MGWYQVPGVEGEPVGALRVPEQAHREGDGHDHRQPEGEASLEAVQPQAVPEAGAQERPGEGPQGPGALHALRPPEDQEQGPQEASVEDPQPPLRQAGALQQGPGLLDQVLPGHPCGALPRLPDQAGQGPDLPLPRGGKALLLPAGVRHQVGRPLDQGAQQEIARKEPQAVVQAVLLLHAELEEHRNPGDGQGVLRSEAPHHHPREHQEKEVDRQRRLPQRIRRMEKNFLRI